MQDTVDGLKDTMQDVADKGSEAQQSLEQTTAGKTQNAQQMADAAQNQVQQTADASQMPDTLRLYQENDASTGTGPKVMPSMAMLLGAALGVGGVAMVMQR